MKMTTKELAKHFKINREVLRKLILKSKLKGEIRVKEHDGRKAFYYNEEDISPIVDRYFKNRKFVKQMKPIPCEICEVLFEHAMLKDGICKKCDSEIPEIDNSSNRKCKICNKSLTKARYFHCTECYYYYYMFNIDE